VLTRPILVAASRDQVRLTFDQLTLDWMEYGSFRPHAATWTEGMLDLLSQGG
jgi:hypothetical protein